MDEKLEGLLEQPDVREHEVLLEHLGVIVDKEEDEDGERDLDEETRLQRTTVMKTITSRKVKEKTLKNTSWKKK